MSELISSMAYLTIFASTFWCIVLVLIRWNNADKVLADSTAVENFGEEAEKAPS